MRLKISRLRFATRSDDVLSRGNKVMIAKGGDFWIFPKLLESDEIERKVIKTNTGTLF